MSFLRNTFLKVHTFSKKRHTKDKKNNLLELVHGTTVYFAFYRKKLFGILKKNYQLLSTITFKSFDQWVIGWLTLTALCVKPVGIQPRSLS